MGSELFCVCGYKVPASRVPELLKKGGKCGVCFTVITAKGFELSLMRSEGSDCPACHQIIKKLNPHRMDLQKWKVLDAMASLHLKGHEWIKVEHGRGLVVPGERCNTAYRAEAHVGRLKWYGLVDHKGHRTGLYRVNDKGFLFLSGSIPIPSVIYCREGEVIDESSELVFVTEIKDVVLDKDYWDRYPRSEEEAA